MSMEKTKQIDEILSGLDGVQRASAPEFFYTRLKARMEKGFEPLATRKRGLYPVYALAAVILIMFINAAILVTKQNGAGTDTASVNETETLQSIAAEYNINDVSSLYELNEER